MPFIEFIQFVYFRLRAVLQQLYRHFSPTVLSYKDLCIGISLDAGEMVAHFMPEEATMTKEPRMREYELLSLIPNKYTEDEVPKIQEKISGLLKKAGAEITKEINYGKRRLAYPVKHNHYGYYLLHNFSADRKMLKGLESTLQVQDEVLRHLITNAIPEGALPEEAGDLRQIEQPQQKTEEKPQSKKRPSIVDAKVTDTEKKKMAKGSVFDLEKELGVTAEEAKESLETEGKEKSKSDESVDMQGLESKLDEIMGDLDKKE